LNPEFSPVPGLSVPERHRPAHGKQVRMQLVNELVLHRLALDQGNVKIQDFCFHLGPEFLTELGLSHPECHRPIPGKQGQGQPVDLVPEDSRAQESVISKRSRTEPRHKLRRQWRQPLGQQRQSTGGFFFPGAAVRV
jgi:hypothetical protein